MSKTKDKIEEVRIYGVSANVAEELQNIADHNRITLSSFLKPELRKIRDSYPEYMRHPKKKENDF